MLRLSYWDTSDSRTFNGVQARPCSARALIEKKKDGWLKYTYDVAFD